MLCKNLKELKKELKKRINLALDENVTDVIKDVMTDHIIQDVYDAYEPVGYSRRFDNDGLLDEENIVSTVNDNNELSVRNVTTGSRYYTVNEKKYTSKNYNKPIARIIESGNGYDVHNWDYDGVPRPFIKNTRDDLEQNHYHTEAMKQGLKKQGLDVK